MSSYLKEDIFYMRIPKISLMPECFERKKIQRKEKYLDARKGNLTNSEEIMFTTLLTV